MAKSKVAFCHSFSISCVLQPSLFCVVACWTVRLSCHYSSVPLFSTSRVYGHACVRRLVRTVWWLLVNRVPFQCKYGFIFIDENGLIFSASGGAPAAGFFTLVHDFAALIGSTTLHLNVQCVGRARARLYNVWSVILVV